MNATARRIALLAVLIASAAPLAAADGLSTCTVDFHNGQTRVFEGPRADPSCYLTQLPVTMGNVRLVKIKHTGQTLIGRYGLWMPYRGSVEQSLMNLDADWSGEAAVALVFEAIRPNEPIEMSICAECEDWSAHYGNLALEIGPNWRDTKPVSARNRCFGHGPHTWWLETTLRQIYHRDTDRDRFTVLLQSEGRGPFLLKWLQVRSF